MNKRKSDDEFARINLSFINQHDKEIVVYCPESKTAQATQYPIRRDIHDGHGTTEESRKSDEKVNSHQTPVEKNLPEEAFSKIEEIPGTDAIPELKEQHFTILYGETEYSYESILTPYLAGAKTVGIEDPYIRFTQQIQNFVRFCEAIVKTPTVKKITLYTSYDEHTNMQELSDRLNDVKQSLIELDIELDIKINEYLHDREIRIDNGWIIKIGRGLYFYQKPDTRFNIGVYDQTLKKCLETKMDIFRRSTKKH